MKPTVSPEIRQNILDLRRRHSLSEVAKLTGLPLGTVKTICRRSGQFTDNMEHRQLFTLPPIAESQSTALAVPELPPKQAITGDAELDAIIWLQQVVSTGNPDLIEKAKLASAQIKTSTEALSKRYMQYLCKKHPGDTMRVAFASFGFGDLDSQAEKALSRAICTREAVARFGSETACFNKTPAEQFVMAALEGIESDELTKKVKAILDKPPYSPHTLSDCLYELAYWRDLWQLRSAVDWNLANCDNQEEWLRRDYVFWRMSQIRPQSKSEAQEVLSFMLAEELMDRGDDTEAVLFNLLS